MKALWLVNPDNPMMRVLVIRGFWARLWRPQEYATQKEIKLYMLFLGELHKRRYTDWPID
jgi:hypothetical protein